MAIVAILLVTIFILYESLKGTGTAISAPVTPLGVNPYLNDNPTEVYSVTEPSTDFGPLDIGGNVISYDETTWPTGDSIWDVCRAIAKAEGANRAGSNPDRLNNPGDISDGVHIYGSETHSGSNITVFPDKETGWKWLYNKIKNAFVDGHSTVFSKSMNWQQLAQKYAANWQNWLHIVTTELDVKPTDIVGDYF